MGIELVREQVIRQYRVTDEEPTGREWQTPIFPELVVVKLDRAADEEWSVQHVKVRGPRVLVDNTPGKSSPEHFYSDERVAEAPPFAQDAVADSTAQRPATVQDSVVAGTAIEKERCTLSFSTSNAEFAELGDAEAAAAILNKVAEQMRNGYRAGVVYDGNGNRIGSFELR